MERAGPGLEKIVGDALHRVPAPERVLMAWPLACGSAVTDRTRVLGFADGVLSIEVADRDWQRELRTLAGRYLAAVNRHAGQNVERIEFVLRQMN